MNATRYPCRAIALERDEERIPLYSPGIDHVS